MSTRCFIGYRTEDKKINGVYCGHDGYPSYVGRILLDNYQDLEKVKELIARGDFSSIGETPDECDWYDDDTTFRTYNSLSDIVENSSYDYVYVYETKFLIEKQPCWYIGDVRYLTGYPMRIFEKGIVTYEELTGKIIEEDAE